MTTAANTITASRPRRFRRLLAATVIGASSLAAGLTVATPRAEALPCVTCWFDSAAYQYGYGIGYIDGYFGHPYGNALGNYVSAAEKAGYKAGFSAGKADQ